MEQDRLKDREEMTEDTFLKDLYLFMKQRDTPIERIPHLGFKQIDLFLMYKTVKDLGGYQQVTAQQMWKKVYNILGGNPRSTSAATCTRRHYEKLLLAYECHQTGYGDNIVFRTPRAQKRFHPGSYSEFDHEFSRGGKQVDFCHIPAFPPTSPGMFVDHQRQMFTMPLNITPYFPHSRASLPNYFSYRESTLPHLSLQDQPPRTPAPYQSESSSPEVQSCKKPIDFLRYLAKEYKSSSGWEEPLNLSRKDTVDTLNDTPSSFRPPPAKKPKFLNEASPLYAPKSLTSEDDADQAETVEARPSAESGDVIDLTSSSGANPVPRRASPPSVNMFHRKLNYPEAFGIKRERDQHPDWQKEESSNLGLLNRSNPLGHQAQDSNGNMEIQIPLKFLQELIRRGLLASPATSGHKMPPEPKVNVRSHSETLETSITCKEPEDLSFRSPPRNPFDTSQQDISMKKHRSFSSSEEFKFSSFQLNNPVSFKLDRDAKLFHPQPVQAFVTKNQERMSPKYAEDTPLSLSMKSETQSEKEMTSSPIMAKETSSSPPLLQVIPHQLKVLLANLPYRLENRPTF